MAEHVITISESASDRCVDLDGLPYEARDLFVRATAWERRRSRKAAARAVIENLDHAHVFILYCAHITGSGGRLNAGGIGCGTERPEPLQGLGSGRRNATDGGAWDDAILDALRTRFRAYRNIVDSSRPYLHLTGVDVAEDHAPHMSVLSGWGDDEGAIEWFDAHRLVEFLGEGHAESLLRRLFLISASVVYRGCLDDRPDFCAPAVGSDWMDVHERPGLEYTRGFARMLEDLERVKNEALEALEEPRLGGLITIADECTVMACAASLDVVDE